jgi:hypothetical protein
MPLTLMPLTLMPLTLMPLIIFCICCPEQLSPCTSDAWQSRPRRPGNCWGVRSRGKAAPPCLGIVRPSSTKQYHFTTAAAQVQPCGSNPVVNVERVLLIGTQFSK